MLLVPSALFLPGCPLKDGYYIETDGIGGAASSGSTGVGGGPAVSNAGRGGAPGVGGALEVGGAPSASGAPGASGTADLGNQAGTAGDSGSGTTGCISVTHQGHEYALCFGPLIQASARANCVTRGMTLAVVEDQAENAWIAKTMSEQYKGDSVRAFIGANDVTTEGEWRWADGVSFWSGDASGDALNGRYTNWADGEPNNESPITGAADCLTMYLSEGNWGDLSCDAELPYVCEPR